MKNFLGSTFFKSLHVGGNYWGPKPNRFLSAADCHSMALQDAKFQVRKIPENHLPPDLRLNQLLLAKRKRFLYLSGL